MKTYSMDLRKRIICAREEGYSAADTAERFKVSKRSVERYWKLYQQSGHVKPKRRGGYRRSRLEGHEGTLHEWMASEPDLTLAQLQERCAQQLSIRIGINALWQRLHKLGVSYKKNPSRQRTNPP